MVKLIKKILITISSPPLLLICSLLLPIPFTSTLSVFGGITLVGPSTSSDVGWIRDFSQAEVRFTSWRLLGITQDISDQFFGHVYPSFAWMIQYLFDF